MNYYVHTGQTTVINNCPKSSDHTLVIGPFETLEAATEYVAVQERFHASRIREQIETRTATDFRIRGPK